MTDKTNQSSTENETTAKSAKKSAEAMSDAERLQKAKGRMNGEKPSLLTRMRSQPYHTATHLISAVAIGSLFLGNRKLGRDLDEERTAHEQTQENLNELQGEYGELTRRAREAGVETADIGTHNVTYLDRDARTGTNG